MSNKFFFPLPQRRESELPSEMLLLTALTVAIRGVNLITAIFYFIGASVDVTTRPILNAYAQYWQAKQNMTDDAGNKQLLPKSSSFG